MIDGHLPCLLRRVAIQTLVVPRPLFHELLEQCEHAHHLREEEHAVTLCFQHDQQLLEQQHLSTMPRLSR